MAPRLAVVTDLPTPYRAPMFDAIARRARVDLRVLYLAAGEPDRPEWSVDVSRHPHAFLSGRRWTLRRRHGPFTWKWNPGVGRALDDAAPDVVCVGGWAHPTSHLAIAWCRRRRVPYLLTSESHPSVARGVRGRARRLVAGTAVRRAAGWLPVSSRAQDLLVDLGADPARCRRVPNAPDTARLAAARADDTRRRAVRAAHGVGGEPVTLFVGRLVPAKGVDVLLDAAARCEARPTLWIVGDGPSRAALEARAHAAGLASVRFLGARGYDDVVALHAAADVVVLPSVHEPYGVALHEGMAAGCAALATDAVGAAHDLVVDGETGFRVPAGDASALATAWATLLADPARLARTGEAAAVRAAANGLAFAVEQTEAAALDAVARSARAAGPPRRGAR